jgi:hypothetical protein
VSSGSEPESIAERQKPPPGALFLDHVAHFVPDLGAAGALAESLGFVVTDESVHRTDGAPAGTSNRCIMLEEGYIEILAPTLDTPNARRVRELMKRYQGVHLACLGTPAAEAEHRRLADHGFQPEPLVNLERTADDSRQVRFKVVYVAPGSMPEGRIQYVEQMTPEHLWITRNLAHANGVTGLRAIYVVAEDPVGTAARWSRFTAILPSRNGESVELRMNRGSVIIASRDGLSKTLGDAPDAPALAGYALACRDAAAFAGRCAAAGLAVKKSGNGYAVALPPSLGGTWVLT